MQQSFRKKLMNQPNNGIWRILPSPVVTEMLAQCGIDFQILDCEHGNYDQQTLLADLMACDIHGCAGYIRVSGTDKVEVQRCLDLGAKGIVFPGLQGLSDFERVAAWMDYAPTGNRGLNPFVRASSYGIQSAAKVNSTSPLFIPIIETLEAVEQLDEILSISRIDLVYLGTYDLSAQLGCAGEMTNPKLVETIDRILRQCRKHHKASSTMALSPELAGALREKGVTAIVHGVDTHRIKEAFCKLVP